jgi:COP9 signalosome complex subunit 8
MVFNQIAAFFRDKTFQGISRAYEAIRPEAAAAYLGLGYVAKGETEMVTGEPSPTLIGSLTSMGWIWDADEGLFHPQVPVDLSNARMPETNGISQLVDLIGNYGD